MINDLPLFIGHIAVGIHPRCGIIMCISKSTEGLKYWQTGIEISFSLRHLIHNNYWHIMFVVKFYKNNLDPISIYTKKHRLLVTFNRP